MEKISKGVFDVYSVEELRELWSNIAPALTGDLTIKIHFDMVETYNEENKCTH